jgi:hypothetical protein
MIKIAGSVCFSSGLEAMMINKVQVYFTQQHLYQEIQNASDHGVSTLNNLTSENERWGLKVKRLEIYRGSKRTI